MGVFFIPYFVALWSMHILYNLVVFLSGVALKIIAVFNKKINLFIEGRKGVFAKLTQGILKNDQVIWVHCASLGEFEQGRPIIERLKAQYPSKKLVLTFFSPSRYEVRKNYKLADVVLYLPLDSNANARNFLDTVHPEIAIFVKYEFWPNYLNELKRRNIKTILISGIFRENQTFFKWYGSFMRKALQSFSYFFVQDENSKRLLNSIHFENVTVSGDTRFDRVFEITQQNNELPFIDQFKNNTYTIVAGSTWKDDENLLVKYINNSTNKNEKFIIAPHNINALEIEQLKNSIQKKVVLFSEKEGVDLSMYQVFIIDTIERICSIVAWVCKTQNPCSKRINGQYYKKRNQN